MPDATLPDATRRNIAAVRDLAAEVRSGRSRIDRITDAISGFAGSPRFLIAQIAVVVAWVIANATLPVGRFDPYPFEFLNFALAVEAILLSTIVLMAQNRQAGRRPSRPSCTSRSGSWPSRRRPKCSKCSGTSTRSSGSGRRPRTRNCGR